MILSGFVNEEGNAVIACSPWRPLINGDARGEALCRSARCPRFLSLLQADRGPRRQRVGETLAVSLILLNTLTKTYFSNKIILLINK
jgi:hypothetical protein